MREGFLILQKLSEPPKNSFFKRDISSEKPDDDEFVLDLSSTQSDMPEGSVSAGGLSPVAVPTDLGYAHMMSGRGPSRAASYLGGRYRVPIRSTPSLRL